MQECRLLAPGAALAALVGFLGSTGGCDNGGEAALASRLNDVGNRLAAAQKESSNLKDEVARLKRELAQALANPAKVVLTDPEVIELVAKVQAARSGERPAGGPGERPASGGAGGRDKEIKLGRGDLNPAAASQIVLGNAGALQTCYERALKKNASLQYRAGLDLTLGLTIRATGAVQTVDVNPSVDREMTLCMKSAAGRWRFPAFSGDSVTLEQKLKLTPKT